MKRVALANLVLLACIIAWLCFKKSCDLWAYNKLHAKFANLPLWWKNWKYLSIHIWCHLPLQSNLLIRKHNELESNACVTLVTHGWPFIHYINSHICWTGPFMGYGCDLCWLGSDGDGGGPHFAFIFPFYPMISVYVLWSSSLAIFVVRLYSLAHFPGSMPLVPTRGENMLRWLVWWVLLHLRLGFEFVVTRHSCL